ncbi:MAG: hypothetical protein WCB12_00395 [Bryobacteraceae bacterium]
MDAGFVDGMLAAAAASVPMPSFSLPGLVTVGTNEIGLSGSLALLAPTVTFKDNPDHLIDVTCGASGTVRLTDNGASLIQVDLSITTSLTVGIDVLVTSKSLAVRLDLSKATVSSIKVDVSVGPPLAPVYETAIKSSAVLSALSKGLQSIPPSALTFTIPGAKGKIDVSYSGITASVEVTKIVVVPLDGVLNVAADASPYTSGDESSLVNLITTASPSPSYQSTDQFGNVTFGGDIFESHSGFGVNVAVAINSNFLCAVVNGVLAGKLAGTTTEGVTISSLSLSVASVESELAITDLPTNRYDSAQVSLNGSYLGQSFNVVAAATPLTISIPSKSWLEFVIIAFDLSLPGVPWWEAVFFPISALLGAAATSLINSIANSFIDNMLASNGTAFGLAPTGSQSFPGLPGWNLSYNVVGVVVWAAASEIDAYASAGVSGPTGPPPAPLFQLSSPGQALTDKSAIPVTLSVRDASLFDSLLGLRVTWKAVRLDTGLEVLNQDSPLTAATAQIEIDRWTDDLKFNDTWSVSCEVYRPADALLSQYTYYNGSVQTGVTDVVNRHHPYVRWDHSAGFHDPVGVGPLKSHQLWLRKRHSRIHRTDVLIRCERLEMEWTKWRAESVLGLGPLGGVTYLDSLSGFGKFDDVARWRHGVLCDYCFFGGPTKTEWKTPTLPTKSWE